MTFIEKIYFDIFQTVLDINYATINLYLKLLKMNDGIVNFIIIIVAVLIWISIIMAPIMYFELRYFHHFRPIKHMKRILN